MAVEEVTRFLRKLTEDESLALQADDAYVEALHRVASAAGYGFSEDDLRAGLDAAAGDLSESELDQVVGGATLSGSTANTVFGGTSGKWSLASLTRFSSLSGGGFSR